MWYRFCVNYIDKIFDEKEKQKFTNSKSIPLFEEAKDPNSLTLENYLDGERDNTTNNKKQINESIQPIRVKSTGQGADALLNTNKDLPMYSDNFTHYTGWE
jgi:hypothetical protein